MNSDQTKMGMFTVWKKKEKKKKKKKKGFWSKYIPEL